MGRQFDRGDHNLVSPCRAPCFCSSLEALPALAGNYTGTIRDQRVSALVVLHCTPARLGEDRSVTSMSNLAGCPQALHAPQKGTWWSSYDGNECAQALAWSTASPTQPVIQKTSGSGVIWLVRISHKFTKKKKRDIVNFGAAGHPVQVGSVTSPKMRADCRLDAGNRTFVPPTPSVCFQVTSIGGLKHDDSI